MRVRATMELAVTILVLLARTIAGVRRVLVLQSSEQRRRRVHYIISKGS
jgi:hypothetical protein